MKSDVRNPNFERSPESETGCELWGSMGFFSGCRPAARRHSNGVRVDQPRACSLAGVIPNANTPNRAHPNGVLAYQPRASESASAALGQATPNVQRTLKGCA
jgi:hypothetical protein